MAGVSDRSMLGQGDVDTSKFFRRDGAALSLLWAMEKLQFSFSQQSLDLERLTHYKSSTKFGVTYLGLWNNICFVNSLWNYKHLVCHFLGIKRWIFRTFSMNTSSVVSVLFCHSNSYSYFYPHLAVKSPRLFLSLYIIEDEGAVRGLFLSLALGMERVFIVPASLRMYIQDSSLHIKLRSFTRHLRNDWKREKSRSSLIYCVIEQH